MGEASYSSSSIAELERIGHAVWPPAEVLSMDGWRLFFTGGLTGRANSVQVLESDPAEPSAIEERILACEEQYRDRGLPARFKLTTGSRPVDLDRILERRGYRAHSHTQVLTLDLGNGLAVPESTPPVDFATAEDEIDRWFECCKELNEIPEHFDHELRALQARIARPLRASCEVDGQMVAVGLGGLHAGWLFLGEVATHPAFRRRSLARALVLRTIERGRVADANAVFLQVVADNAPALALYRRLGFSERYRYWYRAQPSLPERL